MAKKITHYRYEKKIGLEPDTFEIELVEYHVTAETNMGYWIKNSNPDCKAIWVYKESDVRFAYTTKKEAFSSFVKRVQKDKAKAVKMLDEQMTFLKLIRSFNVSKLYE